jgi:hypothetical protein
MRITRFLKPPILPLVLIAAPLAAFTSLNCGIIALPFTGPDVIAANAHTLKFTVNIQGANGQPLDGVTIKATRFAMRVDPVWGELGEETADPPRVVGRELNYDSVAKYAVAIEYSKPGYVSRTILYSLKDDTNVPPSGPSFNYAPRTFRDRINITSQPHSKVMLATEPPQTHPHNAPPLPAQP